MTQPYSAGSLVSTVDDLARWDAALYTEALLKKPALDQMWTAFKLNDGKVDRLVLKQAGREMTGTRK